MIKVLEYKANHIKTKIKPQFFRDVANTLKEQQPCEDAISRADVKKYLSAPNENGDRVIYESDLDLLQPVQLKTERWIPVSERLPEEKINPITENFYEYQCTMKIGDFYDVRSFKFGRGHWWHGGGLVDEYVIAWMPLLEPYEPQESEEE